jgi:hypothetical protein
MNNSDEQLNQLLNRVTPVPPSSNLAERIIAQARIEPELSASETARETEGFFKQMMRNFILPKPAYALACSMLLGVFLGWQNTDVSDGFTQSSSIDDDISSLFIAEVNYYE